MSAVKTLNRKYGKFFKGCCVGAVIPYFVAYDLLRDQEGRIQVDPNLGCLVLSIIPILPALTLVTFSLALGVALLGLISMPFAYAGAAIKDAVDATHAIERSDRDGEEGEVEFQTYSDEDYDDIEGTEISVLRSSQV